ncbi:MAG: hypothetical protein K1X88_32725 [Nannocystaceae bacterium]|nr:hypothetical protein [Nannocystaceae bacterium]
MGVDAREWFATVWLAASLCAAPLGCTRPRGALDASPAGPSPARAEPTPTPGDPAPSEADTARAEAQRILEAVAAARSLELVDDVHVEIIDKPSIRAFAQATLREHTAPEHRRLLGRIESALGVLPRGADPEQVLLELLEDGVRGLYDPKTKTLFIGDFVRPSALTAVVGHEIAHGLQDMHFGLARLQQAMPHQTDAEVARQFLVEGDAQAAYLAWASKGGIAGILEPLLRADADRAVSLGPIATTYPVLRRQLLMPYADGTATVIRLVKRQGWAAVDALFAELPASSEQMLHIDKLIARELPVPVALPATAHLDAIARPAGLSAVWHDELGEATLLAMLAEIDSVEEARAAAAGWGGDHFVVYEDADATTTMVAGLTVWDTPADAKQFEAVFARYLGESVGAPHAVARRGARCAFAVGVPSGVEARAIVAAVWKDAVVGGGGMAR